MKNLRRVAVVGMAGLLGAAAVGSACGGDDSTPNNPSDGGGGDVADTGTPDVISPTDSGADGGAVIRGNLYALNNLPTKISAVRYCFAVSASGEPSLADGLDMTPQPANPAGLAATFGARIDSPPELVGSNVKVFFYYVDSLEAFGLSGSSCKDLLATSILVAPAPDGGADAGDAAAPLGDAGSGTLVQTVDFDAVTMAPSGISSTGRTILLTDGCPKSSDSVKLNMVGGRGHGYCGDPPSFSPALGDLHVIAYTADTTAPANAANNRMQGFSGMIIYDYVVPPPQVQIYLTVDYAGDASVPINGPVPNDIVGPDAGPGSWVVNYVSGPALPSPGQEIPPLTGAVNFLLDDDLGHEFDSPPSQLLAFSNLASFEPGAAYTLAAVGSPYEPLTLADGGANPLYNGLRIIPNK